MELVCHMDSLRGISLSHGFTAQKPVLRRHSLCIRRLKIENFLRGDSLQFPEVNHCAEIILLILLLYGYAQ